MGPSPNESRFAPSIRSPSPRKAAKPSSMRDNLFRRQFTERSANPPFIGRSQVGDFLFVPPGVPHEAINLSTTEPARAIIARNDPAEQDKVVPYKA